MILHTIQDSPTQDAALSCCLRYSSLDDTLLLIGDGVNALLHPYWKKQLINRKLLLLEMDVSARGLTQLLNQYQQISSAEFVKQTMLHSKVISW
ncbi:sulfurtransferase complex subunit TusB [Shewanella psychrotolerans]|uniref:sulfurtransferase complex subunit TusB n=1 Tax=Shewanella psychrotolerans TaxID=2864206 RepID=UPI001C65BA85|nr:sulfurtransferase complex subunit TusB [Shewanella psychrotolerans]QYK03072.1 sulfurtransferase complex subunit TusB [Shewanella psychrotolerans]